MTRQEIKTTKLRMREISSREVEVLNDLVAIAPYRDIPCVTPEYNSLMRQRGELREAFFREREGLRCLRGFGLRGGWA